MRESARHPPYGSMDGLLDVNAARRAEADGRTFTASPPWPAAKGQEADHMAAYRALLAEFIGTFMLSMAFGLCVHGGASRWNALGIGSTLMVLLYSLVPISGGNFNPAVTLMVSLLGKLPSQIALGYAVVQVVGSLSAGLVLFVMLGEGVPIGPTEGFEQRPLPVFVVEATYSAVLCFVVANCIASSRNNPKNSPNQFYGLAVGFVIVAGGYAAGGISGGVLNPAIAIGLGVTSMHAGILNGFVFAAYELVGALVAAALFRFCRPEDRIFDSLAPLERENYEPPHTTRVGAEFIGSFVLTFTVGLNVVLSSEATALSAGAALMCMIYALGDVSGGHFNPAVTLAVRLSGRNKCHEHDVFAFIAAQMLAGLLAGVLAEWCRSGEPPTLEGRPEGLAPQGGHSWFSVLLVECVFTALLCFVVLAVATVSLEFPGKGPPCVGRNAFFALAIGLCVITSGFAAGPVSGGVVNPAVAVGLSMSTSAKELAMIQTSSEHLARSAKTGIGEALSSAMATSAPAESSESATTAAPEEAAATTVPVETTAAATAAAAAEAAASTAVPAETTEAAMTAAAAETAPVTAAPSKTSEAATTAAAAETAAVTAAPSKTSEVATAAATGETVAVTTEAATTAAAAETPVATKTATKTVVVAAKGRERFVNFFWYGLFELAGGLLAALAFHATHPHEFQPKNELPHFRPVYAGPSMTSANG